MKLREMCAIFLASAAISASALAKPPAGADPRMAPWFELLKTPSGMSCCGISDCREVEAESPLNSPDHKHWWALISRDLFGPQAPNRFIMVPDSALQIDDSDLFRPKGPVACWLGHQVLNHVGIICFRPPRTSG